MLLDWFGVYESQIVYMMLDYGKHYGKHRYVLLASLLNQLKEVSINKLGNRADQIPLLPLEHQRLAKEVLTAVTKRQSRFNVSIQQYLNDKNLKTFETYYINSDFHRAQ